MAVGENFIAVRNSVLEKQHLDGSNWILAQGTLYPDIIESGGTKNSKVIKTHHNRVDGIQELIEKGLVIEPLKDLYKDEVRSIGKKLGLEDELVMRHPFLGRTDISGRLVQHKRALLKRKNVRKRQGRLCKGRKGNSVNQPGRNLLRKLLKKP